MSSENRQRPGAAGMMRGHGAARGAGEKPKDFAKTWGKLIRYCKKYLPFLGGALLLAMAGALCALLVTDCVTVAIVKD